MTGNDVMEPVRPANDVSASISILRGNADPARMELIGDVIAAYGRLRDSVRRFLLMFAPAPGNASQTEPRNLDDLLSGLHERAEAVAFSRMDELEDVIEAARRAEQARDIVFTDPRSDDGAALRGAAAMLERLDKTFVGLCVEHVIEERARMVRANAFDD